MPIKIRQKKYFYQLLENGLSNDDLNQGIKVLKSKFITMNKHTLKFEKEFAKKLNAKYALMVNSGSSANLLAAFAACNPARNNRFKRGDEVLIPVLCWPTSLWPLVQTGLKPKFIDINIKTLNVDADKIIKAINKKTKVIMLVNVLGISTDVEKVVNYAKKKKIIVIEDNCEALGAKLKNKYLGTFGDFGTFSFFYSHQITCGEGGMITCNNKSDYKLLISLRSHGWTKDKRLYLEYAKKYPNIDPRYIFVNEGFNLRPTDIQAAIANNQFKKLSKFIKDRNSNKSLIIKKLKSSPKWNNQFNFVEVPKTIKPSYMGLAVILNKKYKSKKKKFIEFLEQKGIETRPILSGPFTSQPSTKLFNLNKSNNKFPECQKVQDLGFLIGLNSKKIKIKKLNFVIDSLLKIDLL